MLDDAEQSAALIQRFKHEPVSDELVKLSTLHGAEFDQACTDCEMGYDLETKGSLVAITLGE